MTMTEKQAARLIELAYAFQAALLAHVHDVPAEAITSKYTKTEAEALADEIQNLCTEIEHHE